MEQEFSVTRRGAACVSLWFVLAGGIVSLPFWKNYFATTLLLLMAYTLLCLCLGTMHFAACRVRAGAHHLTVRSGVLLLRVRRLPLRFITGCVIFSTPLQRLTRTCCLVLYASGSITLVPGAARHDAETLAARLTQGGHVL